MIEELTSLEDERLDVFLRLTEVQLRNKLEPEKGIFIAESAKVVSRALDAGYEPIAALMPFNKLGSHTALIERLEFTHPGITIFTAPDSLIQQLTGYELTRGVLVAFRRKPLPAVGDVIAGARRVAILEDITNHTNIGALFRSAAALGVDALILNQGCCDPLYRRAIRVSMGTVFQVPWTRLDSFDAPIIPNTTNATFNAPTTSATSVMPASKKTHAYRAKEWPAQTLRQLTEAGFITCALALKDDSVSLSDSRLKEADRLAMVFGTEGEGLADETIALCDYTVKIPMKHGVDSLNVAAASAVTFWELCN